MRFWFFSVFCWKTYITTENSFLSVGNLYLMNQGIERKLNCHYAMQSNWFCFRKVLRFEKCSKFSSSKEILQGEMLETRNLNAANFKLHPFVKNNEFIRNDKKSFIIIRLKSRVRHAAFHI